MLKKYFLYNEMLMFYYENSEDNLQYITYNGTYKAW